MKNTPANVTNDLFALKNDVALQPIEIAVKHPKTGKSLGFFVTLRSMDSEEVQKVGRAIRTKANKLALRQKAYTAEEERENSIAIITAAIEGWRWGVDDDGNEGNAGGDQLEFNPLNVKKIVSVDAIRNQLDAELGDTAQFFR